MADDKSGREKQARDADNRQRRRDIEAELERGDEPEPPIETDVLAALESELEPLSFPVTGAKLVAAVGDTDVPAPTETYTVAELVPDAEVETFDSPRAVRLQIQRPTVAMAMKRVVEASTGLPHRDRFGSQREAYLKTFHALQRLDGDDDDALVSAVAEWIVEQIHEKKEVPGSRAVRRQAAKLCRANGYQIRNDDWLGV
ncbi:DUF5789 family protein [Halosegnis longus]|uniref:Uncharacterized protein n=1 Tax=Halosegnis longus TaxID=2216012 RepID=A0AAJ4R971_9EURY|nr:hypothetical protein [Halosegnis longus]RNJ26833.1 hypothetical protein Nmn1133_09175 [Salella cibi]